MPEFVYQFSSIPLFIFLNSILLIFAIISISLIYPFISLKFRYAENTAIVSCSALLGIIYAILIGFVILYQLNAFDKAESAEKLEGVTLHSLYHNAALLPEPTASTIRSLVVDYTKNAIDYEWPAMTVGDKIDAKGSKIIEALIHQTHAINLSKLTGNSSNALSLIEQDVSVLFNVHHERTATVHTTLNGHIWFVLVLGTILTLGINFFLGMDFRLHIFCVSLIAIVMSTLLYLIVGLDRPYQGDFVVHPDTIGSILDEINAK